jgi:hypothetical protein
MRTKIPARQAQRDAHHRERHGDARDLFEDDRRLAPTREVEQAQPERTHEHAYACRNHRLGDDGELAPREPGREAHQKREAADDRESDVERHRRRKLKRWW